MAEDQEKPKTARRADRLHHEVLVAYRVEGPTEDGFSSDWAVNISEGGLFINTRKPRPVGTEIRLFISLPDTVSPFELLGKVARVNTVDNQSHQVPGMAIEFHGVDDETKARIDRFVDRLRKELPEEPGPGPANKK